MRKSWIVVAGMLVGCGGEATDEAPEAWTKVGEHGLVRFSLTPDGALAMGENGFTMELSTSEDGTPLDGASVMVHHEMPGHGHDMAQPTAVEVGDGTWRIEPVFCPHLGAYVMEIHVEQGELHDAAAFSYDVR